MASYDSGHFQIPNSSYIEVVDDEVPSYESSQLEQQMVRSSSTSSLRSRIPRNTSSNSFQDQQHQQQQYPHQRHNRPRSSRVALSKTLNEEKRNLKRVGLQFLTARQLFGLALGRDLSLLAIVRDLYKVLKEWYRLSYTDNVYDVPSTMNITNARSSEFLMAALWCTVSGYFTYQILDSLMIRWIIIYSPSAVIVRMVSMSMFIIMIIHLLTIVFNPDGNYYLHVWILISCSLTGIFIIQSFVTSNLSIDNYKEDDDDDDDDDDSEDEGDGIVDITKKKKARFIDLYNITVFAVVPIGLASFITMIGLIWNLLILKLDFESVLNEMSKSQSH